MAFLVQVDLQKRTAFIGSNLPERDLGSCHANPTFVRVARDSSATRGTRLTCTCGNATSQGRTTSTGEPATGKAQPSQSIVCGTRIADFGPDVLLSPVGLWKSSSCRLPR